MWSRGSKALRHALGRRRVSAAALIISTIWSGVQKVSRRAHNIEPTDLLAHGDRHQRCTQLFRVCLHVQVTCRSHSSSGVKRSLRASSRRRFWEIGRQVLSIYFLRLKNPTAYGVIGSFMAIMLWAYYAMLVVLFGAEYVRVRQREREIEAANASSLCATITKVRGIRRRISRTSSAFARTMYQLLLPDAGFYPLGKPPIIRLDEAGEREMVAARVGAAAGVVEALGQDAEAHDVSAQVLQRPLRGGRRQAYVPRCVQAAPVPDARE